MLICGILYFLTIGYRFLPNNATGGEVGSVGEQRDYSHVPQWKQRLSLVVLIATILGMIFEKKIGVSGRDRLYWRSGAGSKRRTHGKTGL